MYVVDRRPSGSHHRCDPWRYTPDYRLAEIEGLTGGSARTCSGGPVLAPPFVRFRCFDAWTTGSQYPRGTMPRLPGSINTFRRRSDLSDTSAIHALADTRDLNHQAGTQIFGQIITT